MIRNALVGSLSCAIWLAAGCAKSAPPAPVAPTPEVAPAGVALPAPTIRRLTRAQYANAVHDVLGAELVVPTSLEPDTRVEGFLSIGAAQRSLSARGVNQYEAAAIDLSTQALATDTRRARLVPCTPTGPGDAACLRSALVPIARRLFRRPLETAELDAFVAIGVQAGTTLARFEEGLVYALSALLQSPEFLYRIELGRDDPERPGQRLLTGLELASRLSFFLWNTTPDDALLDAAMRGDLDTPAGIASEVDRLLADPRARVGLRAFATEWLRLDQLDALSKDAQVFVHFGPDLGPSAREETLLGIEHLVFTRDADFRELLTTRETFLNRKLASIYFVRAPAREGFALTTYPEDSPRRGLLGQVSVLALQAHPTTSSPTLRGKFVREQLLCDRIPDPPASVQTTLAPPDPTAVTLRARLANHREDPVCSSCHSLLDPIGVGLENFDGLGRYRTTDNGAPIGAPANDPDRLDGVVYKTPAELAQLLHDHPRFPSCVTRKLWRYATGRFESEQELVLVDYLANEFALSGYKLRALIRLVATSDSFRRAGDDSTVTP